MSFLSLVRSSWNNTRTWCKKHPTIVAASVFLIVWIIASVVFYLRFPQNATYPNFFAEDGQHFVKNTMDKGVIGGLLTAFNGYFIFGIYVLTNIGFAINNLLLGGSFTCLPLALAITSYSFLGLCCALPVLLLRRYMKLPYLLTIALLMMFMPFPTFDYGVIGTIGNLKFPFAFIAVLLVMYRAKLSRDSKKIFIVDSVLLLCAYTTASVYLLLPFLMLEDGLKPHQLLRKKEWPKTFSRNNLALWSGLALCSIAMLQVVYVAINGTPELVGYLDEPYEFGKSIEIFLARSYLYPIYAHGYTRLNDTIAVLTTIVLLTCIVRFGSKSHRPFYALGIASIFAITAVFTYNRTGISHHFFGYTISGLDNFFYTQNFIFIVFGVMLLSDINQKVRWFYFLRIAPLIILWIFVGYIHINNSRAPNDYMQYHIGTLQRQAVESCDDKKQKEITFMVYPFDFLTMTEPRSVICTETLTNYDIDIDGYELKPTDNMPLAIGPGNPAFTQTFVATGSTLKGMAFYLSTYYQTEISDYHLFIKDKSCKRTLRSIAMPEKVRDNTYRTVTFEPIQNVKGKTFCFNIQSDNNSAPQLALQLSAEDVYGKGVLTTQEEPLSRDIVFRTIYK